MTVFIIYNIHQMETDLREGLKHVPCTAESPALPFVNQNNNDGFPGGHALLIFMSDSRKLIFFGNCFN